MSMQENPVPTLRDEVIESISKISQNQKCKNYFFDLIKIGHRVLRERYENIGNLLIEELKKQYEIGGRMNDIEFHGNDINGKKVCVKINFGLYLNNDTDQIYEGLWDIHIVRNDSEELEEKFYPEFEIYYYNVFNSSGERLNQQIKSISNSIRTAFQMPSNHNEELIEKTNKIIPLKFEEYRILTGEEIENLCNQILLNHKPLLEEELKEFLGFLGDEEYYNKR